MSDNSILYQLNVEIAKRINEMNDPSYNFGEPLNRKDYIWMFVIGAVCIAAMISGM